MITREVGSNVGTLEVSFDKVTSCDNSLVDDEGFRSRILTRREQLTADLMRSMSPPGFISYNYIKLLYARRADGLCLNIYFKTCKNF